MSNLKTAEEIWQEFSETLSHDIDLLSPFAGKEIMTENNFLKAMHAFHNQHKLMSDEIKEATEIIELLMWYGSIHTITGVTYPEGTHTEALKRARNYLHRIRDKIFKP